MFEINQSSWPVAIDANDPRDQFHRTALAEATIATERRPYLAIAAAEPHGVLARLRLALTSAPTPRTEPCNCPA